MLNIFSSKKKAASSKQIKELAKKCEELSLETKLLKTEVEKFKKDSRFFVQKVAILRFNPFQEQGGDQSFSIALLDGQDSGVIITSLHSQQENRVYAKPIEQGKSKYPLSAEEEQVLSRAKTSK